MFVDSFPHTIGEGMGRRARSARGMAMAQEEAAMVARRGLGFPWWLIVALAALAVPRVIAHDLRLVAPGGLVNRPLVFVPPLIWLAVVLWRRAPRPFLTLLLVGVCYGVLLAAAHQVLWSTAVAGSAPQLGGCLAGRLDPATEALLLRAAAAVSGVATGTGVGVLVGLIGAALTWLRARATEARLRGQPG